MNRSAAGTPGVNLTTKAPDNTRILMFAVAAPMCEADLPPFKSNPEASERIIIRGQEELAFPIHTQVVADYFRELREGRAVLVFP